MHTETPQKGVILHVFQMWMVVGLSGSVPRPPPAVSCRLLVSPHPCMPHRSSAIMNVPVSMNVPITFNVPVAVPSTTSTMVYDAGRPHLGHLWLAQIPGGKAGTPQTAPRTIPTADAADTHLHM